MHSDNSSHSLNMATIRRLCNLKCVAICPVPSSDVPHVQHRTKRKRNKQHYRIIDESSSLSSCIPYTLHAHEDEDPAHAGETECCSVKGRKRWSQRISREVQSIEERKSEEKGPLSSFGWSQRTKRMLQCRGNGVRGRMSSFGWS